MSYTFTVVIGVPTYFGIRILEVDMIDGKTHGDNTNTIIAECRVRDDKDFAVGHILRRMYQEYDIHSNPVDRCAKSEIFLANNSNYILYYGIGI